MHIDNYSFGNIVINGKAYKNDVLVVGTKIREWWRDRGHLLQNRDLNEIWKKKPRALIIGRGASGTMDIDGEVKNKCSSLGINFLVFKSPEAVKKYNAIKDKDNVALGIHLTC